ncbi:adenosine 3'-phospho 5'-phosphosulfate transporter 1 isoform X2 [Hyposmocoma kahamanoa]|uniref:adenosine 3'-phospho 5'-phosphosulfate transporter 1 isoform X2 n=1 Tax=Hyposmocoma kahamanoa TaxID=1477025 RepID=UPI000E6D86BD|nr:adenosine 3'-phospho 5'-phosphosulfate transporter 1 isoform X2 [Hyposmocoma kahamanoa]
MRSKISIGLVIGLCSLSTWLFAHLYKELLTAYEQSGSLTNMEYSWFFRLLLNFAGYATVLLPLFIMYKYIDKTNYFDKIVSNGCFSRCLVACFGEPNERMPDTVKPLKVDETPARESLELAFCFAGLMGAYLVWGLLQEKIMTQNYVMPDGSLLRFNDSQFLVFINRLLAFTIALARLICMRKHLVVAPLYKFSFCSLTNVISAWCQYEALKYVSFPTQVLSKSCKVIPVMLMGKVVSRNKYELYEYVTAGLISVGMVLFMFGSHDDNAVSTMTTMSGFMLLALYMMCDSFTSSWQDALFMQYNCNSMQMLCGVNLFSCLLTASALLHHSSTMNSIALLQHPVFASDCFLLSVSSAIGQLIIYHTVSKFGAVVFTIIMTLRQL